jgi:hypothetical protein
LNLKYLAAGIMSGAWISIFIGINYELAMLARLSDLSNMLESTVSGWTYLGLSTL